MGSEPDEGKEVIKYGYICTDSHNQLPDAEAGGRGHRDEVEEHLSRWDDNYVGCQQ